MIQVKLGPIWVEKLVYIPGKNGFGKAKEDTFAYESK